jgi:hypothetical protein
MALTVWQRLRRRVVLTAWLGCYIAVATVIVARTQRGFRQTKERETLLGQLEARQAAAADLERRLQDAGSRGVLLPKVAAAGYRVPSDTHMVMARPLVIESPK